MLEAS